MKLIVCSFCLLALASISRAQPVNGSNRHDAALSQFGAMQDKNVSQIADTLSLSFPDKRSIAYAFYYWIAHHIAIDPKATRANDQRNILPEQLIQFRKGTPLGIAKLFQEMCSQANIRCLVVDGYTKFHPDDIQNPADDLNHAWNVIQLGQSPTEWYYVDAAKAAGSLDKRMTQFTPAYNSAYFFAEKTLFNLDHLPDHDAWLLGTGPKGKKEFYALPWIGRDAYTYQIYKPSPATGLIKTKLKNPVRFSFQSGAEKFPDTVQVTLWDGNKAMKPESIAVVQEAGSLSFSYTFKRDGNFVLFIQVQGKDLLGYQAEVVE